MTTKLPWYIRCIDLATVACQWALIGAILTALMFGLSQIFFGWPQ